MSPYYILFHAINKLFADFEKSITKDPMFMSGERSLTSGSGESKQLLERSKDVGFPSIFGLGQNLMSMDLVEGVDEYVVTLDIPGISKDNITLKVDNDMLCVEGERKFEARDVDPNDTSKVVRLERQYGTFKRQLRLPKDVILDNVRAHYHNGVLKIVLPKERRREERRSRTLTIE